MTTRYTAVTSEATRRLPENATCAQPARADEREIAFDARPNSRCPETVRLAEKLTCYATTAVEAPPEDGPMSAPQNQPPYQPPYQPQYQAVTPYGQQRPRQTHVGKLVVAIILFVIGPLMGLAIWGIGSVIAVAGIATSGDVVTNGQQVSLSSNDERALYVSRAAAVNSCTVVAPDGKEVRTSPNGGMNISNNDGDFSSVLTFKADKSGDYRVSCEGLDDTDAILVGPTITFSRFTGPFVAALVSGVICWIIAAFLLIRRHRALAAQNQAD